MRTRLVYVAINPWQPGSNCYISHLIGPLNLIAGAVRLSEHITYITAINQLSDLMKCECPTPSSTKATNSNIKNAWNNINGIRMKHQSLLSAQHKVHVHQERPSQFDMVIVLGLGTRLTWRLSNNTLKSFIRAYILYPYGDVASLRSYAFHALKKYTN